MCCGRFNESGTASVEMGPSLRWDDGRSRDPDERQDPSLCTAGVSMRAALPEFAWVLAFAGTTGEVVILTTVRSYRCVLRAFQRERHCQRGDGSQLSLGRRERLSS